MSLRGVRSCHHAGSWYTGNTSELSKELDQYLERVPQTINGHSLPIPGARVIIAPHAGYQYSGPCAAWAYKSVDLRRAKRVFILGPSHTYYLHGCALTTFANYDTPFGIFRIDAGIIAELRQTGKFKNIPRHNDLGEHSLEMHLPYIWKALENTLEDPSVWPTIVPIMVGDIDRAAERAYGRLLLPYFEDPDNAFVVSSDFCHWGRNFQYRMYSRNEDLTGMYSLSSREGTHPGVYDPPVYEFIQNLDKAAFKAIESGVHGDFGDYLFLTENTICGRHPIGVAMAALKRLADKSNTSEQVSPANKQKFVFIRYERSYLATTTSDSSVSYASAYAIL